MDRKKVKLDSETLDFVNKVKLRFNPTKVILFGSRARGDAWNYSDYDFIVVSDKFERVHWLKRISRLVKCWSSDRDIDVLPYTSKEFEDKKKTSSMIKEAVQKGIEV
jgi:predicted nucleotidyltransferase